MRIAADLSIGLTIKRIKKYARPANDHVAL